MPILKNIIPRYRKHRATGQAVVTLSGKDYYLGPHGTKTSKNEYDRLVAEWLSSGRRLETEMDAVTVTEVIAAYLRWAKSHYRKQGKTTSSYKGLRSALRMLKRFYGRTPASEFGPKRLKALIFKLQDAPSESDLKTEKRKPKRLSLQTINKHAGTIRRLFRWAAAEELVPPSVPQALSMVRGLEAGKCSAPESDPVAPVRDDVVEATLPFLPQVVADMVRLQLLTGMRPAEVCIVRSCDIDRTGQIWLYSPHSHKTEYRGNSRVVALGPQAQELVRPYLLRADKDYCFSPRDSERKRRQQLTANRQIPWTYGNRPGSNRKRSPQRTAGERYKPDSYRRAITRACDLAKVEKWSPNQLRHSAATKIRSQFGLEAAQVTLGHTRADVTQVYAERDMQKAIEVARQVG